ncbi:uncharacterized protein LOC133119394 [Conger conger]|uniref:uncharacterized protein LOC133119394 n=1 Tax=Conger conger TaxID=82655 RepID=UPI002A5AB8F1|nr:uncharacterized protein LOC133119394 [Conger conger]
MEETFIPGPMFFFDQSCSKQRRKRSMKLCHINLQLESNKKSTKSGSDGESAVDDELSGGSPGRSERKGRRRSDALLETDDHGNSNDEERDTEATPAALQEEVCGEVSLFEEYRLEAPQLLMELERLLCMCQGREDGFFPNGLENVLNYTWRQLTDGAVYFMKRQVQSFTKPSKSKGSVTSDKLSVGDPAQEKTINAKKTFRKKPGVEEKFSQEPTNLRNKPTVTNGHKSLLSTTISFSISSEVCQEQGWVVQSENLALADPRSVAVCQLAVERLQQALIPIKEQNAELAERGFTHPLILRHYGDAESDCVGRQRPGGVAYPFPPYRRPSVTEPRQEEPAPQKLHYRITDGTSFLYYPSGYVAVCQSHSGLPCGGFYTMVFSDAPKASVLATFTPLGHATITHQISDSVTVWDQRGGVTYDPSGTVAREWTWPPDGRPNKPILIESGPGEDPAVNLIAAEPGSSHKYGGSEVIGRDPGAETRGGGA